MSLYGFLNIIFEHQMTRLNYTLAYLGSGLAVATKGLLGLVPVLYAFLFCFFYKSLNVKLRELLQWEGLIAAVLIALLWFGVVYMKHGDTAIQGFFTDQVGKRFSGSKLYILVNIRNYAGALLRHFFPWSVLLAVALFRTPTAAIHFFRQHKEKCLFISGWYFSFLSIFLLGNINRSRYLFSTYPLLCILTASLLTNTVKTSASSDSCVKNISILILAGGGFCASLLAMAGIFINLKILAGGMVLLTLTALIYAASVRQYKISVFLALGLYTTLIFAIVEIFLRPVFRMSPAPQLVQCISHLGEGEKAIALGLSDDYASQIRVLSRGQIEIQRMPESAIATAMNNASVIILSESIKRKINLNGFMLKECGYDFNKWKVRDLWEIIATGNKGTVFDRLKEHYYIAVKVQPTRSLLTGDCWNVRILTG
jgi:4-amino-4-deoxy-L-arabinose transferase-like glycosyltransferase